MLEAEAGIEFGPFALPLNGLPMMFSPAVDASAGM